MCANRGGATCHLYKCIAISVQKDRVEINRKIQYLKEILRMTTNKIELGKTLALLEIAKKKRVDLWKSQSYIDYVEATHAVFSSYKKSGLKIPDSAKDIVGRTNHPYPSGAGIVYTSELYAVDLFANAAVEEEEND